MEHLYKILDKKSKEFLDKLFSENLLITEKIDGVAFKVFFNKKINKFTYFKRSDKNPINILDRTLMKLYEQPIEYFENNFENFKDFFMKYSTVELNLEFVKNLKTSVIVYNKIPRNNLILTSLKINDLLIDDIDFLNKVADFLKIEKPPIIFNGKLNEKQKKSILEFLNTDKEKLKEKFKTESFAAYIFSILNPELKSSFLQDSFQKSIEGIVINFKDSKINAKLVDPLFEDIIKKKKEKLNLKNDEKLEKILKDFADFIKENELKLDKYLNKNINKGDTYYLYINLISNLFLDFFNTNFNNLKTEILNNEVFTTNLEDENFKLNYKFIENEKLKNLLKSSENLENLFKIILLNFKFDKKRVKYKFQEEAIKIILNFLLNFNLKEKNSFKLFLWKLI